MKSLALTSLALIAFAANSLLARAGLIDPNMGPMEFTFIRLISGASMMAVIYQTTSKQPDGTHRRSWWGAAMLFLYALLFSLAYVTLDTGLGALCLFTSVQLTIIGVAAFRGNITNIECLGAAIAFAGFVYLIFPSIGTPSRNGILMMALSGIGWGVYTLLGRGTKNPIALTSGNFLRASLLALPLLFLIFPNPTVSFRGCILAIISGAITSGCGYAIWYAVLPRLSTAISGVCQLLVPPIAALMGSAVIDEPLTMRLILSSLVILGGLLVVSQAPKIAN